jgi:hypothetical protein
MSLSGVHLVTYGCPLPAQGEPAVGWVASCTCGATSARESPDGTMAGARRWRDQHLGSRPVAPPLDEPDEANDSYDQWLRGVTDDR